MSARKFFAGISAVAVGFSGLLIGGIAVGADEPNDRGTTVENSAPAAENTGSGADNKTSATTGAERANEQAGAAAKENVHKPGAQPDALSQRLSPLYLAQGAGTTRSEGDVPSPDTGDVGTPGPITTSRTTPVEADALAPNPGPESTVRWADCSEYPDTARAYGYPYIQNGVELTNASKSCRGGKNVLSGRLYYTNALSFDATSTDAGRLNGYKVYVQWQDNDGSVSPVYWAITRNLSGSQGGDGSYAFYLPEWTDSRGVVHSPKFSALIGNIQYKLWIAPNQKGPGGGNLVAVRQGPGNGIGFKNGGRDGYFGSFFLEAANLQRTSIWAWEVPQDYMTADTWKVDGKDYVSDLNMGDSGLLGSPLQDKPVLSGDVWWETKEPDLSVNMPTSTREYTAGGSDIWVVSSVLTPAGVSAIQCGPKWDPRLAGGKGDWSDIPAWNLKTNTCIQDPNAPRWDSRSYQVAAVKFQKKLLSENRSLIAQTVASYVHPQPGNPENSPVGYYVARFDEKLVKSIPQGAVPKMGDGIFQYAVRLAYETDEQGKMRRDKNNAPVLKYDENGRPIVTEIVQEISATSAPFYGPRTRWATSAYQYNSSAHPMDDMNHALYANQWSAIDVTNFDTHEKKAAPGDIAQLNVDHHYVKGQKVWIRWRDQNGKIVMSPNADENPEILNPGCWYYGPNDEDPSDNASAATPDNPNGGKGGCWLQVPKNLSGEKLYTAELVVFGDVVDADSFVAVGNGRPDYELIPSAIADPNRPEDPKDPYDSAGYGARLKNVPYWVDNEGRRMELSVDKNGKKIHPHGHFGLQKFPGTVTVGKLRKDGEFIDYHWNESGGVDGHFTICGKYVRSAEYNESYEWTCEPSPDYEYGEVTYTPNLNSHGTGLYELPMRWYPTDENGKTLTVQAARNVYGDIVKDSTSNGKPYIEIFAPFWVENPNLSYAYDYDPQYGEHTAHPLQTVTFDIQWNETNTMTGNNRFPSAYGAVNRVQKCKIPAPGAKTAVPFPEEMRDWVLLNPGKVDSNGDLGSVNWKTNPDNTCQLKVKVPPTAKNGDIIKIPVQVIYRRQGTKATTTDIAVATVKVWAPQASGTVIYDQNGNAVIGASEPNEIGLPGVQVVAKASIPYTDVFGRATKNGKRLVAEVTRIGNTDKNGKFVIDSIVAGDCKGSDSAAQCPKADYKLSLNPLSFAEQGKAPCPDNPAQMCDVRVPGGPDRWLGTVIPPNQKRPVTVSGDPQFTFLRKVVEDQDGKREVQYSGTGQNIPVKMEWGSQATYDKVNTGHNYGLWFSNPRLEVQKTISKVNGADPDGTLALRPGDKVEYRIEAVNKGNTPVGEVTFLDQLLVPMECGVNDNKDAWVPNPLQDGELVCSKWKKVDAAHPDLHITASAGVDISNLENIALRPGDKLIASGTYTVQEDDARTGAVLNHAFVYAKEGFPPPADPWKVGYVEGRSSVRREAKRDMSVCLVKVAHDVPADKGAPAAGGDSTLPECKHIGLTAETPKDSLLQNKRLAGAEFTLYEVDDNGQKIVDASGNPTKSYPARLNGQGVLVATRVPAGQYLLEEQKAPAGYQLLPSALALRLFWDDSAPRGVAKAEFAFKGVVSTSESAQVLSSGSIDNPVEIAVGDSHIGTLPKAGRIGVLPFIIAGGSLFLAAVLSARSAGRRQRRG